MSYDLLMMTLVIFVPTAFALLLLFFPKGSEEYMRWWALLGAAITLVISLWIFIDFQKMLDIRSDNASLRARAEQLDRDPLLQKERDYIGRIPWIPHFHIDYYLGVDGISMALVLLTTALSFL